MMVPDWLATLGAMAGVFVVVLTVATLIGKWVVLPLDTWYEHRRWANRRKAERWAVPCATSATIRCACTMRPTAARSWC